MDTATIAVVISGTVAMGALVVTPVITFINEWFKWRRESKRVENDRFLQLTTDLIESLSRLQVEQIMYTNEIKKVHSKMLKHYYLWELMLQARLRERDKESLLEIRSLVESQEQNFHDTASVIADKILAFSASYVDR